MIKPFSNLNTFIKHSHRLYSSFTAANASTRKKTPFKVLFFGSDEFSLYSLKALFEEYNKETSIIKKFEVVTCSQINAIWKFAIEHKLVINKWPPDLKTGDFDLGLVVSFGHLIPESCIHAFPLGILNVHGSLLPRWRGASPIVYALAHGDKETGVTIMKIKPNKFDIGEILHQEKVLIPPEMEMPELHEKLGKLGASCLVETIKNIDEYLANCKPQPKEQVTYAPKITPEFGRIKWNTSTATDIHNLQRALKTILPLKTTWNALPVKLLDVDIWREQSQCRMPGFVEYSRRNKLLIVECANMTWISVKNVGIKGKKNMSAVDFYNGFISKLDKNTVACFK